ncbi:MAG: hypothetical protein MRECE_19c018 [Mycoplasmataceae bacterium CE_OT135]|nr:MAG: hypothetical protein MRECE_19c018 [Mycoplasmataceae bacterium CE_OT135]
MIIITRQREALKSQKVRQDLNSILSRWNWGNTPFQTSQEFLNKFAPWVQEKIKLSEEVKTLLERKGVEKLEDIT